MCTIDAFKYGHTRLLYFQMLFKSRFQIDLVEENETKQKKIKNLPTTLIPNPHKIFRMN